MRKLSFLTIILSVMAMTACQSGGTGGENPLLMEWDTPFGMPPFEKIKAEHYRPAFDEGIALYNADIQTIIETEEAATFENTILAFDQAGELYSRLNMLFYCITSAENDDAMKKVEAEITPILTKQSDDIYLNEELYARVKVVFDNRHDSGLDALQLRLTEKIHRDFMRAGTHLNAEDKAHLRKLNEKISSTSIAFGNNIQKAMSDFVMYTDKDGTEGLPQASIDAAKALAEQKGEKEKYAFTLDKPSMLPFLTYSPNEKLREELYRGYIERCQAGSATDNTKNVNTLMELRLEKAELLGYKNHAEYELEVRVADSPKAVYTLLDEIWTPALNLAKEELGAMKVIKKEETGSDEFNSWDWWYFANKVKVAKYDFDEEIVRPFFSLSNVRSGIFQLCNRLYGITFRPVSDAPVYHEDCEVYEVLDKDGSHLAAIIMDFHPRSTKNVGAWCSSYRSRTYIDGEKVQDPVVTVVCNFTEPTGNKPALLSLDEVETFFHEFGHAIHSFFIDVPYTGLARVERDFVELPSQVMENWAFEPEMLKDYALHYQTNDPIKETFIEKINNSGTFNMGFVTTELLAAAYSDMDVHTITDFEPIVLLDYENKVLNEQRGLIKEIEPRYRLPYFRHVFRGGYAAGYYSYIWSEVLDKDAYEAFVESGDIFSPKVAKKFRDEVLSKGGSLDGMELYRNFRGQDPDTKPLLYGRGLLERPIYKVMFTPPVITEEQDEE